MVYAKGFGEEMCFHVWLQDAGPGVAMMYVSNNKHAAVLA